MLSANSELHVLQDSRSGLQAAICVQRNNRGPALGGCRFVAYASMEAVIEESVRLSKAMSYKAAVSGRAHNGGKAVIKLPEGKYDREKIFKKFAEFVHSLQGSYITTIDSGTTAADMAIIRQYTPFVTGYSQEESGDASLSTALGVFCGIESAVNSLYQQHSLQGLHVEIQGLGKVGYRLAELLYQAGAQLTVCDVDATLTARAQQALGATVVRVADIYRVACDVFSPCALGRVINDVTLSQLRATMIAGAANDQLSVPEMAERCNEKNIVYIPDFLINAGGLIHLSLEMDGVNKHGIDSEVRGIGSRIVSLLHEARVSAKTLYHETMLLAEKLLHVEMSVCE